MNDYNRGFLNGYMSERVRVVKVLSETVVPKTGKLCKVANALAKSISRAGRVPPVDVHQVRAVDEFDDIDDDWGGKQDLESVLARSKLRVIALEQERAEHIAKIKKLRDKNNSLKFKLINKRA